VRINLNALCAAALGRVAASATDAGGASNEASAGVSQDLCTLVEGWIWELRETSLQQQAARPAPAEDAPRAPGASAAPEPEVVPLSPLSYVRNDSDCGRALEVCAVWGVMGVGVHASVIPYLCM